MTDKNDRMRKTRELLTDHYRRYPKLEVTDIFKFIHQSASGCEHLVSDEAAALDYIKREYAQIDKCAASVTEKLDGDYCRVYLAYVSQGLKPETLARLFFLSAKNEADAKEHIDEKLDIAKEMIKEGSLPFDADEFNKSAEGWRALGYPAVRHSESFRGEYRPAYRVIAKKYADFITLFTEIDKLSQCDNCVIAIEGGSAGGKTTLAAILQEVYDCNVFHTDDFFLRPEQRTQERLSEVGGNFDRERFEEEILKPLSKNENIVFRRFDCMTKALSEPIAVEPKRMTVIEGVYSMHPSFKDHADLSVFLKIDAEYQRERILIRNSPAFANRFFEEWIPLENVYFNNTDIEARCDVTLPIGKDLS